MLIWALTFIVNSARQPCLHFTYNHAIKPANSYILISLKEFDSLKRYTDCHLLHT